MFLYYNSESSIHQTLKERGFSEEELEDMSGMISSLQSYMQGESSIINRMALLKFQTNSLIDFGKTEKIRIFAANMIKALDRFS